MRIPEGVAVVELGKHDAQGKRLANPGEKKRLLEAFELSGLTQHAFAKQEGIKYYTFATWVRNQRLREQKKGAAPKFLEVGLPPEGNGGFRLEITFPDGIVIRGYRCAELLELARAMR
jgi:hypothetical protein